MSVLAAPAPVNRYAPGNAAAFTAQADGAAAWRRAALDVLAAQGLPTPRLERWKYTNMAGFILSGAVAAGKASLNTNPTELPWLVPDSRKFVFVNGHRALGDARLCLDGRAFDFGAAAQARFGDAMFAALNGALAVDGPDIDIADDGAVFEVLHVAQAGEGALLASPRGRVRVAAHVSAVLVEQFCGLGRGAVHSNAALEIVLEEGARLTHIRLQNDRPDRMMVLGTHAKVARDASYKASFLNMGAGTVRQEFWVELEGPGAGCAVKGAQLACGRQLLDTTVQVDHKAPHCTSNQTIRNVLADEAVGVFQGKVFVDRVAQKTDGYQLCNTLMLSARAQMNTKPELEIYADDVKCSHGTTTGQMDDAPLFYMRSRGIPEDEARQMMLRAFIGDLFSDLPDYAVSLFDEYLEGWLEDASQ